MVTLQQAGNKLTIIFFLLHPGTRKNTAKKCKECRRVKGKTLNVIYSTTELYMCII